MDEAEVINSLKTIRENGFDDSFAAFCANVFSSREYPPGNLAAARMHAHYLRLAIEIVCDGLPETEGEDRLVGLCRSLARECMNSAVSSERPFTELFVESWCRSLGKESDSKAIY